MLKETATKVDLDINSKMHVVDGGWLLYQVKWSSWSTIKTLVDTLCQVYVQNKFKDATVVFDGYVEESSTKDHEHMRRLVGKRHTGLYHVTERFSWQMRRTKEPYNDNDICKDGKPQYHCTPSKI